MKGQRWQGDIVVSSHTGYAAAAPQTRAWSKQCATTRSISSTACGQRGRREQRPQHYYLHNFAARPLSAPSQPHLVPQQHQVVVGGGGILLSLVLQGLRQCRHVQPEVFGLRVTLGGVTVDRDGTSSSLRRCPPTPDWAAVRGSSRSREEQPLGPCHTATSRRHYRYLRPWAPGSTNALPLPMQGT